MGRYILDNSGMAVEAEFSEANVEGIFLPLLHKLSRMQRAKGGRVVALLAAPPGAGKSTLAAFLAALSQSAEGCPLTALGMDGFHRYQAELAARTVLLAGERVPMTRIKGAPETFDLPRLAERLARVAAGERCGWPAYDRRRHDPAEDAVTVTGDLILVEGNYLLLDAEGWRELRGLADYAVSIAADPALLRWRLLARHLAGGKSPEAARAIVDGSDMKNIRLCLEKCLPADLKLELLEDNTFRTV